ncbi:hypothetical protein Vadar_025188 [Vaccinium darrowii]|uniref:Uncharacterized protein n=1 Tax=Vaccinium darrowii TaxID=229202 RepID=A0ACB7ZMT9_9ERIC|nr:hypothetical protein Vadar_025188 [Vaccinium darrowii]
MADSWSKTKSSRPSLHSFQRSISPSGRFCSSSISSSISNFSSKPSGFLNRRPETASSSSPSVRFSIDQRPTSPSRSISVNQKQNNKPFSGQKKTCMCSPTTHPGSFRCSLHKNVDRRSSNRFNKDSTVSYHSNRLYARRSAMTNSLVRIGTVEGDLVKRALAALIRPSSHQQRRRGDFQPRPSRLSVMSKAEGE